MSGKKDIDVAGYWAKRITKMLDSGEYENSADFLFSVGRHIEKTGRISQKQIDTIKDISNNR